MGRYFGIKNNTKKIIVSQGNLCWKDDDFCDCHEVMHRYHWESMDKIVSVCYDTECKFVYNSKKNEMCPLNVDDISDNESNNEYSNNEDSNNELVQVGFDGKNNDKIADHVPIWKNNKCQVCNYVFKNKNIEKDKTKFNSIFFMN